MKVGDLPNKIAFNAFFGAAKHLFRALFRPPSHPLLTDTATLSQSLSLPVSLNVFRAVPFNGWLHGSPFDEEEIYLGVLTHPYNHTYHIISYS